MEAALEAIDRRELGEKICYSACIQENMAWGGQGYRAATGRLRVTDATVLTASPHSPTNKSWSLYVIYKASRSKGYLLRAKCNVNLP